MFQLICETNLIIAALFKATAASAYVKNYRLNSKTAQPWFYYMHWSNEDDIDELFQALSGRKPRDYKQLMISCENLLIKD